MNRLYLTILTSCILFTTAAAQRPVRSIHFKNGDIDQRINLIKEKMNGSRWQQLLYQKKYYALLSFDQLPQTDEKIQLSAEGVDCGDPVWPIRR